MVPEHYAWITLLLPLVAVVMIMLFARRDGKFAAQLSIGAAVLSFLVSIVIYAFFMMLSNTSYADSHLVNWLKIGSFEVELGLRVDPLCLLMLLVVTGVGSAIHVYSYGYMKADPGCARYFAGLSLFMFSMIGIVLANNFVLMFIFWELVGFSSYLLIGFWYERPAAADAAKKAFLTNRLGDYGFLLGILLIWGLTGKIEFDRLSQELLTKNSEALGVWSTIAGLLIFCGAMGKSAQFPLHVWLPDAMEGPTPVSALIHAATMVAAGVYMLCRVSFLFEATPAWPVGFGWLSGITALDVIAWVGAITSLLAALIAVQQNDIKRILAYSTLSQLGYMVMTVGLSAPTPAMYHLTTHAFFKALLFLGAGSVIHMLHHEQDIWKMGGLKNRMPITYWTFLIAALALCGLWPLSGFYSKDEILANAYHENLTLFVVASFVAFLTSFYMFRLIFVAFTGRQKTEAAGHAKESPPIMSWTLLVLAVPTVIGGFIGIKGLLDRQFSDEAIHIYAPWYKDILAPFSHAPLPAMAGIAAMLFGIFFAYGLYERATEDPLPEKLRWLARAMRRRFYFDEIYAVLIAMTNEALSYVAYWIDRWIIAGLAIRGLHGTTEIAGRALRMMQTGNLQTYAFWVVLGLALLLFFALR